MNRIFAFILVFTVISQVKIYSQTEDFQIGQKNPNMNVQGALYDYSEPGSVNKKVAVWGFVKFPGKYIVPDYTSVNDLISFAGGPTEDATLEDIRIYRSDKDSSYKIISFNYKDLLWNKEVKTIVSPPALQAGDILLVPGEDRLYFRDYFGLGLSIVSALVSVSILIINIVE